MNHVLEIPNVTQKGGSKYGVHRGNGGHLEALIHMFDELGSKYQVFEEN